MGGKFKFWNFSKCRLGRTSFVLRSTLFTFLVIIFETFAQDKLKISTASKKHLISLDLKIYRAKCARCHGQKGQGQFNREDVTPKVQGNYANLATKKTTIQIIRGGAYMPKIDYLSDQSLATHIRNYFNNKLGNSNVDKVYELHQ